MEELVQLGIRKEQIPELGDGNKWCLISPSNNKEGEEVYYVFEKGEKYYTRVASDDTVTDPILELLGLLDKEKQSAAGDAIPITIKEKRLFQKQHIIVEAQKPAIDSFLRIIYGEEAQVGSAKPKTPVIKRRKGEQGLTVIELMPALAIITTAVLIVLGFSAYYRFNILYSAIVICPFVVAILLAGYLIYHKRNKPKEAVKSDTVDPVSVQLSTFTKGGYSGSLQILIEKKPKDIEGHIGILAGHLSNTSKSIVDKALEKLYLLGYSLTYNEWDAFTCMVNPQPVQISQFDRAGRFVGTTQAWIGREPKDKEEHLAILIEALKSSKKEIAVRARTALDNLRYSVIVDEAKALIDLIDAKPVNVSAFNEAGEKTGEEVMWLGERPKRETMDQLIFSLAARLKDTRKAIVDSAIERLGELGYSIASLEKEASSYQKSIVTVTKFDEQGNPAGEEQMFLIEDPEKDPELLANTIKRLCSKNQRIAQDARDKLSNTWKMGFNKESDKPSELGAPVLVVISQFDESGNYTGKTQMWMFHYTFSIIAAVFMERLVSSDSVYSNEAVQELKRAGYGFAAEEEIEDLIKPQQMSREVNGKIYVGIRKEYLIGMLKSRDKRTVEQVKMILGSAEFGFTKDEENAIAELINPVNVAISQFDSEGNFLHEENVWLGRSPKSVAEHIKTLIKKLNSENRNVVRVAENQLNRLGYYIIPEEEAAFMDLVNPVEVSVSQFGARGDFTNSTQHWMGKKPENRKQHIGILVEALKNMNPKIVRTAVTKLREFGYEFKQDMAEAMLGLINFAPVRISVFDPQGIWLKLNYIFMGRMPDGIEALKNALLDGRPSVVREAMRRLREMGYGSRNPNRDTVGLIGPFVTVEVSQFDATGTRIIKQMEIGIRVRHLIKAMQGENETSAQEARDKLSQAGFLFIEDETDARTQLVNPVRVWISQFTDGRKTGKKEIWLGKKPRTAEEHIELLIKGLRSTDKNVVEQAETALKEGFYFVFDENTSNALTTLEQPVEVRVSLFNGQGTKIGEKTVWIGRLAIQHLIIKTVPSSFSSLYTRTVEKRAETEIATAGLGYDGEAGGFEVKGDLTKLAGILGVEKDKAAEKAAEVIQAELDKIRDNPEYGIGIFGAVKEIVLVDNLGGMESITEGMKGANAELKNGRLLIDIDAFRNLQILADVLKHELWHSILEKVEGNTAVQEVTAIYQNLLEFAALGETEQSALIEFLRQGNNGLDSREYAELLQYVKDKKITGDQLIALAISYVSKTARYDYLKEGLKSVMAQDVEDATKKLELAKTIYENLIMAVTEWKPVINKVKTAEFKSKALMKVKMIAGKANISDAGLVDSLNQKGKFVKLYVEDLEQDAYITEWLVKILEGKEKSPFLICSRDEDPARAQEKVAEFLSNKNIKQADITDGINAVDIIDARDIGYAFGRDLPQGCLSLPLICSVSGIYLAGQVVLVDGNLEQLKEKDPLAYNSLTAMYTALFGDTFTIEMLKQIIFGIWPNAINIIEDLEHLRTAIKETEKAA